MVLGAIIGLIGAAVPEVIKLFHDYQDRKHELEVMKLQIEMQKTGHIQRLEEIQITADTEVEKKMYDYAPVAKPEVTGRWWFDVVNLFVYVYNTTVRPTITYILIGAYCLVKWAQYQVISRDISSYDAILKIWQDQDNEFVAAVVVFWVGGRQILRSMGKIK